MARQRTKEEGAFRTEDQGAQGVTVAERTEKEKRGGLTRDREVEGGVSGVRERCRVGESLTPHGCVGTLAGFVLF